MFICCAGITAVQKPHVFSTGLRGTGCSRPRSLREREICWPKRWSSTSLRERCGDRAEMNRVHLAQGRAGRSPTRSLCAPWARLPSIRRRSAGAKSWCDQSGLACECGDIGFDEATELPTRLREARITLGNVNVWPNPDICHRYKYIFPVVSSDSGGRISKGDIASNPDCLG